MEARLNKYDFAQWQTNHLMWYVGEFESLSLSTHQINNLHLYHAAIAELYSRFPNEKHYQYRHWYFSEENPSGDYKQYISFIRENGGIN